MQKVLGCSPHSRESPDSYGEAAQTAQERRVHDGNHGRRSESPAQDRQTSEKDPDPQHRKRRCWEGDDESGRHARAEYAKAESHRRRPRGDRLWDRSERVAKPYDQHRGRHRCGAQ